jgi:hypothetical protein
MLQQSMKDANILPISPRSQRVLAKKTPNQTRNGSGARRGKHVIGRGGPLRTHILLNVE